VLVHFDDLYRAALRLTGNVTDAEDLTQDTCLRAFECLDQLRNSAAARLWVFTILRSIFLRRIERQSAQPRQIGLDAADTSLLRPGEILPDVHEAALAVEETTLAEAREGWRSFRCRIANPSSSPTWASRTRRSPRPSGSHSGP